MLLDSNVLSELVRPRPSPNVVKYLASIPIARQFVSVLSIGEIRFGVEKLKTGQRHQELARWLASDVLAIKAERILPVSLEVAERWGKLKADAGRTLPVIDSLLAATALHHDFDLVTRNTKDFVGLGLRLVDPFVVGR